MNATELRQQSVEQLNETLLSLRAELFNLRIQHTTQQLNQTHLIKQTKKNIARVKTLLVEKAGE